MLISLCCKLFLLLRLSTMVLLKTLTTDPKELNKQPTYILSNTLKFCMSSSYLCLHIGEVIDFNIIVWQCHLLFWANIVCTQGNFWINKVCTLVWPAGRWSSVHAPYNELNIECRHTRKYVDFWGNDWQGGWSKSGLFNIAKSEG